MWRRMLLDLRRHWIWYGVLGLIWLLAMVRLLFDPVPHVPLLFNWTPSVPYSVAWVRYGAPVVQRGDFVIYAFHGEAIRNFPGLAGQPFFKQVAGVAGDVIKVHGRTVSLNGIDMGVAKRFAAATGLPLEPIAEGVIPAGYLFMHGSSDDSFDSRYRLSGLVAVKDVIAVVLPLF